MRGRAGLTEARHPWFTRSARREPWRVLARTGLLDGERLWRNDVEMSTRTSFLLLLCSATLMACFPQPPDYTDGPETPRNFNRATFESQVMPALKAGGCLGCHNGNVAMPMGGFGLYPDPANADQSDQNFERVVGLVSTRLTAATARMAQIYLKATEVHSGSTPLANAIVLENWIVVGLGGEPLDVPDPGPDAGAGNTDAFDADVFASDIQEIFDENGCTANCHNAMSEAPLGLFGLTPMAFPGSAEMEANRLAVIEKIDTALAPENATQAKVYVKATTAHSGSTVVTNSSELTALESWISLGLMGQ